jgi:hypothetical protein
MSDLASARARSASIAPFNSGLDEWIASASVDHEGSDYSGAGDRSSAKCHGSPLFFKPEYRLQGP